MDALRSGTRRLDQRARIVGSVLLVLGLVLPFLGKPVHLDDANFLRLAEGAAQDPWRPHAIAINWLGTTQRAFDVLSNPPGIAWWLAPVRNASEVVLHAWMLPWLALALFGMARLGRAFGVGADRALLVLGTSPVFLLSAQSLTPDLPLLACGVAGLAGFMTATRAAWGWALLAGCASLFRYSGLCFVPLILLAGIQRRRLPHAAVALLPAVALALHDLHAYGEPHVLAMLGFQGVSYAPQLLFRKVVAALAMLGGACVLPVLGWCHRAWGAALVGAALGLVGSLVSHHTAAQMPATVLCAGAGAASFLMIERRDPERWFLSLWFLGGCVFLMTLQFMATRYWLPFFPAVLLLALRRNPTAGRLALAVALSAVLSLGMSIDDYLFASAYKRAALEVADRYPPGVFAGHWGWQYYLERRGWRALEAGTDDFDVLAAAMAPWPQRPSRTVRLERLEKRLLPDPFPGPRLHSWQAAANYHAWSVKGQTVIDTYAPWSLSSEPYDEILVFRRRR